MATIFRKEMADYFTSIRIVILFLLVFGASAEAVYHFGGGDSISDYLHCPLRSDNRYRSWL